MKLAQNFTRFLPAADVRRNPKNIEEKPITSADRLAHQCSAHRVLSRYVSFEGKEVLEVGGNQSGDSMIPFLEDGAANGIVTGLYHVYEQTSKNGNLHIMRADALKLSSVFGSCRFDVVYGLSIVEHIPHPKHFLDEVYAVLKPGGVAYFQGRPIWSSPKGHHLWVASWGGAYKDRTTANYLFNKFPGYESINPLPDWSHLLMTPDQMRDHLTEQKIPSSDIDCIIDWVFTSDEVNRIGMSEIAEAYTNSKLIVLEANTDRVDVPQDIQTALQRRHGEGVDYGISGVTYVLAKPR